MIMSIVLEYVNCLNLLSDFQSGFRRGLSTATALVRVTEDLRSAKAGGKVTVHVLLEFSKAFDLIIYMGCLFISSTHGMTFILLL
jgi:hypothetical protein